jgi:hormone-sensitive lipase
VRERRGNVALIQTCDWTLLRKIVQMSTFGDDFDRPFEDSETPLQWGTLRELCCANVEYFASHQDDDGVRIKAAFQAILDHLDKLQSLYREIAKFAPDFDFEDTPANGYRSFLSLVDKSIVYSSQVCQQIYNHKNSMLFRKSYYMK